MMTIHEQYNENLKFIDNLQKRKSKTEGSIETRNQEIIKIREEITKLSEKLKSEYNLDPANLLSRIEDLRTEFNENAEIIKNNLEKLDNKDE
jgi:chromosome segregation ATPase